MGLGDLGFGKMRFSKEGFGDLTNWHAAKWDWTEAI